MVQPKIELRKIRDFGENLNDSIQFIRQEFKPLLSSFILIAGIFILSTSIINGMYQSQFANILTILTRQGTANSPLVLGRIFNGTYFLVLFFSLLNFVAMRVTIASYFKIYDQLQDSAMLSEVWDQFKRYFIFIIFYSLVIWVMIIIGFFFCVAPGIYLLVVLTPFELIVVVENKSFSEAVARCFQIIRQNFWISLGTYIVSYFIYVFSAGIISAIVALIAGLISYFTTKNLAATVGLVTGILNIFSYIFFILFYVSVAMHYFNLCERADGEGIMRKIETLGNNEATKNNVEEEY